MGSGMDAGAVGVGAGARWGIHLFLEMSCLKLDRDCVCITWYIVYLIDDGYYNSTWERKFAYG